MIEWNIDPVIFTLGPLSPRYYGVLWALAFVISYYFMRSMFADDKRPQKDLDSLTITMIISTMLGARLGHLLFYEPHIILDNPLEVFAIWHGGLASHGGALGIITGLWIFHKRHKGYPMIWLLDRLAVVAAISGFCIRVGNFFNSEIIGRETDLPWAVWFKLIDPVPIGRHPAQLYEALLLLGVFFFLWWRYKQHDAVTHPGRLFGLFMVLVFSGRFLIEFIKEHQVAFESSLPIDMGQILSIPFVATGIWFLVISSRSARTSSPS